MVTKRGLRTYRDELYPSKELKVYMPNLKLFFQFMRDRQLAWHNRFVEHLPRDKWTTNKILQVTKYTNVYRQLDRGSLWAIHNILLPAKRMIAKHPENEKYYKKNALWRLILYRMCCRVETFEKVGLPMYNAFNPVKYHARLKEVLKEHAAMTNAFLTCPCPKGMNKIDGFIIGAIHANMELERIYQEIENAKQGSDVFDALNKTRNMGKFFAYEVYCDMCYSGIWKWTTNDFVNIGPGCMEGLRMLFPSIGTSVASGYKRLYMLSENQDKYFKLANADDFKYMNWLEPVPNKLSLRTIEHSLCEFSKYWLQLQKIGKRRLEYDRWSSHPNCVIGADGISVTQDEKVYAKFKELSKPMESSKMWNQFGNERHTVQEMIEFMWRIRKVNQ
jgi:hypothetical protein